MSLPCNLFTFEDILKVRGLQQQNVTVTRMDQVQFHFDHWSLSGNGNVGFTGNYNFLSQIFWSTVTSWEPWKLTIGQWRRNGNTRMHVASIQKPPTNDKERPQGPSRRWEHLFHIPQNERDSTLTDPRNKTWEALTKKLQRRDGKCASLEIVHIRHTYWLF